MTAPTITPVDAALVAVRAELGRVDNKATALMGFAGAGLSGGLAVLGSGRLGGAATVSAWVGIAALLLGVILLGLAMRPRLSVGWGFMAWAGQEPAEVLQVLGAEEAQRAAHELCTLSRSVLAKYRRVQAGMAFLGLALIDAVVTAALV
ncbi:Pycsar system effector family protein [Micromonospora echinofusca]|uniref:Pycsar effector protein domain-containing protein n=1 Tax=Micromonospora echinofusca TaxID=47858 RepID=A0ABS3VJZ4_MICEH|nr:Pycsar system effector family protein [Micromonospora echinofusca]MBO4204801.1 hypothetical protein [Micromonospora echinofusca]